MGTYEKAASIPAEDSNGVDIQRLADRCAQAVYSSIGKRDITRPIKEAIVDAILADRASQEECIREDEPLPERLRKSYERGAQDERDRLYEAGLKWPRDVCDFLEIEDAKVRARLRRDAS